MNDNTPLDSSGTPLRATPPNERSAPAQYPLDGRGDFRPGRPPMLVDFLRAADGTPFTKKFTRSATGELSVEPFPHIRDIDSFREEANSIDELYALIASHAAQNHCMLKGLLGRQLKGESRAGLTDPHAPTQWLLLDLDFDSGWDSVDDFIAELNPAWTDVSYIWQHSSSAGIKSEPGLRGHLWLMLETAVMPASVKVWLKERNLTVPGLQQHLRLTASGMSLRWGLDISTCQNDKLIYIAPPILEGLEDPLTERITLVKKGFDLAPPPPCDLHSQDAAQDRKVAELRAAAGMPRRVARYGTHHDIQFLTNPEPAVVTGIKHGRGFTYLNLNGGDSWGYYFPDDKPDILNNFKDEPLVRLETIAPEFYRELCRKQRQARWGDAQPYVFRDPLTDQYINMLYSRQEDRILMRSSCKSKDRLADFLANHGDHLPDPIPDWTVAFDPTTTKVIDPDAKWVNLFDPTVYLKCGPGLTPYPEIPPTIDKILTHVVAGCHLSKEHFINWLACLVQTRAHLGTSWVFHGVQGTGKGLVLSKVLVPLLGPKQVREWTTKDLDDKFNAGLEHTCLLWLDEFKASGARSPEPLMAKLKNLITEETLPIRAMRTDIVERPNHVNVIIASNFPDPISLPDNDRRFNVAPAQERPLVISSDEVKRIEEELLYFCSYLFNYAADHDKARTVLMNDARRAMIGASNTPEEAFFEAFRSGDLDYVTDYLSPDAYPADPCIYSGFERVVLGWVRSFVADPSLPIKFFRDDLYAVFRYLVGPKSTKTAFTRAANRNRLNMKKTRIGHRSGTGLEMNFKTNDFEALRELVSSWPSSPFTVIKGGKDQD